MESDLDRQVRGITSFLDIQFKGFEDYLREFLRAERIADGGDGQLPPISPSDLEDAARGILPVLLTTVKRAPEHDTEHLVGFMLEWQMVGGSEPLRIISLAQRDQLRGFGDLAHQAEDGDDIEPAVEGP